MKKLLTLIGLVKKEKVETDFSKFFREASSAERKKVFLTVAKKQRLTNKK